MPTHRRFTPRPICCISYTYFLDNYKINLVLGLHQCDSIDRWHDLITHSQITLSRSFLTMLIITNLIIYWPIRLISIPYTWCDNSDVVISSFSTIIFDCLSRFKPCVNLGFDPIDSPCTFAPSPSGNFEHLGHLIASAVHSFSLDDLFVSYFVWQWCLILICIIFIYNIRFPTSLSFS